MPEFSVFPPQICPNQPSLHVSQPNIISVNHDRSRRCLPSVLFAVFRRAESLSSRLTSDNDDNLTSLDDVSIRPFLWALPGSLLFASRTIHVCIRTIERLNHEGFLLCAFLSLRFVGKSCFRVKEDDRYVSWNGERGYHHCIVNAKRTDSSHRIIQ